MLLQIASHPFTHPYAEQSRVLATLLLLRCLCLYRPTVSDALHMPSSHPILHFSLSTFHPKCVCQGQLLPVQYELSKSNRDRDQLIKQVKDLQEAQVYYALSCCQRSHLLPSISCLLPSTICLLSAVSCSSLLELRRPLFSYFASSFTLHCIVLFCTLTKGHLICPILLASPNQRNFTVWISWISPRGVIRLPEHPSFKSCAGHLQRRPLSRRQHSLKRWLTLRRSKTESECYRYAPYISVFICLTCVTTYQCREVVLCVVIFDALLLSYFDDFGTHSTDTYPDYFLLL